MKIAGIEFPSNAQETISSWKNRSNCFIQTMIYPASPNTCTNCNGGGRVYLRLLLGDFSFSPETDKSITWDSGYWHIIENTRSFVCPVCAGKGASATRPQVAPQQVQEAVEGLVKDWTDH